MAKKYKIKITKAYLITIEDKDGYEVASDWSFFDYTETKKQAEKLLAEVELVTCKPMPLPKEIEDRLKAYFQENPIANHPTVKAIHKLSEKIDELVDEDGNFKDELFNDRREDKMASVLSDMIDDGWKIQF